MSGLQFTYRFTGPVDQGILLKNRGTLEVKLADFGMSCDTNSKMHLIQSSFYRSPEIILREIII